MIITFGYIVGLAVAMAMVLTWLPHWSSWEPDGEQVDHWWALGLIASLHMCSDADCWHPAPHRDAISPEPRSAPVLDASAVRTLPRATVIGVIESSHLPVIVKSKKQARARRVPRKEHRALHVPSE